MLVAVVSDSHGNLEGIRRLAAELKTLGVTKVLHLGDDYRDTAPLTEAGLEVLEGTLAGGSLGEGAKG